MLGLQHEQLRGVPPSVMRPHASRVDLALEEAVEKATELELANDEITQMRLRLPARHGGGEDV